MLCRVLCSVLIPAVLAFACVAQAATQAAPAAGATLVPGVLKVCGFASFPPFAGKSGDGSWAGWDLDFLAGFAARRGLRIEIVEIPEFAGFWTMPGQDRCDVAATGISDSPARRAETGRLGHWTPHYYSVIRAFGVRTGDAAALRGLQDLRGKTVNVIANSTAHIDLLNRIKRGRVDGITINPTTDEAMNAQQVHDGAVFAFGSGLGSVEEFVRRLDGLSVAWPHCLMQADGTEVREGFSFVVRTRSLGLPALIDAYVRHPAEAYKGGPGPTCPVRGR